MIAPRRAVAALLAGAAFAGAVPAQAEVVQASAQGFIVSGTATSFHSAEDLWYALVDPAGWWNGEHTWSGDALNLRLNPEAGGCFCEDLAQGGSAEHMRVIYAAPGEMLRLTGALGPLQREGVTGTLTIELSTAPRGTQVSWTYAVGGHSSTPLAEIAPTVDMILAEQFNRMVNLLENPAARP